ncbi:hypothetical protein HPB50_011130 [Hyalomma asiaticum]|uniref:Uncharacterized protein n=1 Tax=Hyalomma asiaticum TaxID=266040 RepID=A0ACB7TG62_HYAAI|nr:hypothetical protein HPB50_011130 [Hyalomma asiaticum]
MAFSLNPTKCVLKGYSDVLDGRLIRFVDELPASVPVCSLCSVVPFEHYSLSCNHVYCSPCFFEIVMRYSGNVRCLIDGKVDVAQFQEMPSATAYFDNLRGLLAYCFNRDSGCSYIGTLEELQVHVRDCYEVSCSLCSARMPLSLLAGHVEAAHSAATPTASRNLKRGHEQVVVPFTNAPSNVLLEVADGEPAPKALEPPTEPPMVEKRAVPEEKDGSKAELADMATDGIQMAASSVAMRSPHDEAGNLDKELETAGKGRPGEGG